jgi:hypothetical protein
MVSKRRTWGSTDENDAVPLLLGEIATNPAAKASLKKLELCLGSLHPPAFELVRQEFTSLESLTLHYMLRKGSPNVLWDMKDNQYWSRYANLANLQLRKCHKTAVPFIPYMVRQFVALRHLLLSVCGLSNESQNGASDITPQHRKGWYNAEHALWKVHQPLETLQIKHGNHWDLDCLGEIPVRKVIFTNFCGPYFIKALKEDLNLLSNSNLSNRNPSNAHSDSNSSSNSNFFPGLELVWIQSEKKEQGLDARPYALASLEEFCRRRNVTLRRDSEDEQTPL